jgi:hypothetical protein
LITPFGQPQMDLPPLFIYLIVFFKIYPTDYFCILLK